MVDGENTLVYGITPKVVRMDEAAKRLLRDARVKMNLKEHQISVPTKGNNVLAIYTSSIVAAHKCDDKRIYFINLSRVSSRLQTDLFTI